MPQHSRGRRRFSLRLLGRWQLLADGEDVRMGHREQRLLALLGLFGQSSRMQVACILWPETAGAGALTSLRHTVLQTNRRCPGLLQPNRLNIGLAADVDVDEVRRAAAATEHALTEGEAGALLRQLVAEELLPDWYDDWVLPERESLEQLRSKALERIARHALEAGDLERSVHAARAASDIDPLLESAGELAIRAHLGRGDVDSALLEFDRYRDARREGLGVPPSRSMLELIEPVLTESPMGEDSRRGEVPEVAAVSRPATAIPGPAREPAVSTRGRGVGVRLLGVAALLLVAALAVAGVDPPSDRGDAGASRDAATSSDTGASSDSGASGDRGASGATVHPAMRVLPAGRAIRPGQLDVHLVDAVAGRAAFLVRTTVQPMLVRLEVRGDVGRSIVRSVLVRSPRGSRLELSGLRPGIYQWLATSSVASAVSGQLRIPDPPATVDSSDTIEAGGALPTVATAPAPQPSSDTPQPHPTPRPHPSGPPKDPGTRPLTPVG